MRTRAMMGAAVAGLALAAAGCGEHTSSGRGTVDHAPADVLQMPDGFPNVAMKCDGHGHRVFSGSREFGSKGAIAVVADETCRGAADIAHVGG